MPTKPFIVTVRMQAKKSELYGLAPAQSDALPLRRTLAKARALE